MRNIWNRIVSVNWILGSIWISVICFIIVFDIIFSECYVDSKIIQFFIKLSFAYFSAFIFYFLAVHLPHETRKAKLYKIISNRINTNNRIILSVKEDISKISMLSIEDDDFNSFKTACEKINPTNSMFSSFDFIQFSNWYQFLQTKATQIKGNISSLLDFYPYLDNEIIRLLTVVDDRCSNDSVFGKIPIGGNLSYIDSIFWDVLIYNEKILDRFNKKYARYLKEYEAEGEKVTKKKRSRKN